LLRALAALKAKSFFMVTPYTDHVKQNVCGFFQANGKKVTSVHTFNCTYSQEIGDFSPTRIPCEIAAKKKEAA
jgi:maleate cis-trans isomerase